MKIFSLFALLFYFGCAGSPTVPAPSLPTSDVSTEKPEVTLKEQLGQLINNSRSEKFTRTLPINIYFATNRNVQDSPNPCSNEGYGLGISQEISYGLCRVNVPKSHFTGKIDFTDDDTSDPNLYFKILSQKKYDFDSFQKAIAQNANKEILVFIHGFNVKFQDAVLRASQLAYDLKFQGTVILFSWPSGAEDGLINSAMISKTYLKNKSMAALSIQPAIDFFDLISRLNTKTNIYIHSMGHQVAIPALVQLSENTDIKLLVDELILNAPDYDLTEFNKIAPALLKLARHITMYCSYNDNAMLASETLNGNKRLGACELVKGIDVINVSEI
ncbi:MAG: alpha/beta hydrolase, partial [Pseudobdellovibrio sp.]